LFGVPLTGGAIVLLTSALSAREYARERNGALPPTMTDFEGRFPADDFQLFANSLFARLPATARLV